MNGQLKFRIWDKKNKIMSLSRNEGIKILRTEYHDEIDLQYFIIEPGEELVTMQFTGLKDKNGKEIYEGDIVAKSRSVYHYLDRNYALDKGIWVNKEAGIHKLYNGQEEDVIYGQECLIVAWQDDLTGFYPFADSPDNCGHCGGGYSSTQLEIVGNIYENGDLVGKESR